MSRTGCLYNPIFLEHVAPWHPEAPARLEAIVELLEEQGTWEELIHLDFAPAPRETLLRIHHPEYVDHLEALANSGGGYLDLDTYVARGSFRAATLAAGAAVAAVEAVLGGKVDGAFALVRPPGHHALPGRGMGFCLLNNVAIAAQHALDEYGLERVMIVDFDAHHGNGTQAAFYAEPRVLYFSTHRYPFYPGTGHFRETGEGPGKGFTVNVPLEGGVGDDGFAAMWKELLRPLARRFQPQLILASAGYDAHYRDPLAGMQLSCQGYYSLVQGLAQMAEEFCQGRLVLVLEGGYELEALSWSVLASFHALMGKGPLADPLGTPPGRPAETSVAEVIAAVKRLHGPG